MLAHSHDYVEEENEDEEENENSENSDGESLWIFVHQLFSEVKQIFVWACLF